MLTTVLKAARAFVETQNIDVNTLEGVGVSATGQIDSRKGIVAGTCGNFPNYINSPCLLYTSGVGFEIGIHHIDEHLVAVHFGTSQRQGDVYKRQILE